MSPAVPDARVDRLSLQVSGLDEHAARELAALVAAGLAPALLRSQAGTGLDHLRIEVPAAPGTGGAAGGHGHEDPAALAERILAGLGRVLSGDGELGPPGEGAVP